jgi:hypothetical protein
VAQQALIHLTPGDGKAIADQLICDAPSSTLSLSASSPGSAYDIVIALAVLEVPDVLRHLEEPDLHLASCLCRHG